MPHSAWADITDDYALLWPGSGTPVVDPEETTNPDGEIRHLPVPVTRLIGCDQFPTEIILQRYISVDPLHPRMQPGSRFWYWYGEDTYRLLTTTIGDSLDDFVANWTSYQLSAFLVEGGQGEVDPDLEQGCAMTLTYYLEEQAPTPPNAWRIFEFMASTGGTPIAGRSSLIISTNFFYRPGFDHTDPDSGSYHRSHYLFSPGLFGFVTDYDAFHGWKRARFTQDTFATAPAGAFQEFAFVAPDDFPEDPLIRVWSWCRGYDVPDITVLATG